jgi:hypothetical protein
LEKKDGICKGFMGIFKSAEKILVVTDHFDIAIIWCTNLSNQRNSYRAFYLYDFLTENLHD